MIVSILATVALWFTAAGILYANPLTEKFLEPEAQHAAVRQWKSKRTMLLLQLAFGVGLPTIVFAFAFQRLLPAMPGSVAEQTLVFGLVLVGLRVIPRTADMALLSTYPKRHLIVDTLAGTATCFVIAAPLAWWL